MPYQTRLAYYREHWNRSQPGESQSSLSRGRKIYKVTLEVPSASLALTLQRAILIHLLPRLCLRPSHSFRMGINSGPKVDPPYTNGTQTDGAKAKKPVHPLGPLSPEEISRSSKLLAQSWPEGTLFRFKSIVLREPTKAELLPYLEAEWSGKELPSIDRLSDVVYYIKNTVSLTPHNAACATMC